MLLSAEIAIDPPPPGQVRHPRTQQEIARAAENVFRIHWSWGVLDFETPAYLAFLLALNCPCAFAPDPAACLRELRGLNQWRSRPRPRPRARRSRQGHGGSRCERGPPGSDDDGGSDPPPSRVALCVLSGARP